MGKADLHIHSSYSFDSTSSIEVVMEQAAFRAGLNVIAITDHDVFGGALRAVELAPRYGIEVIPGIEISTRDGHLLALFLHEPIAAGLSLLETLHRAGEQGGLCIAAHPMARAVHSLSAASIRKAASHPDLRRVFIGLETINAGLLFQRVTPRAQWLCEELGLASTGSSDSHVAWTIGQGITEFPGRGAQDLRQALIERRTTAWFRTKKQPVRFIFSNSYHMLLRKMGYAVWAPEPGGRRELYPLALAHGRG